MNLDIEDRDAYKPDDPDDPDAQRYSKGRSREIADIKDATPPTCLRCGQPMTHTSTAPVVGAPMEWVCFNHHVDLGTTQVGPARVQSVEAHPATGSAPPCLSCLRLISERDEARQARDEAHLKFDLAMEQLRTALARELSVIKDAQNAESSVSRLTAERDEMEQAAFRAGYHCQWADDGFGTGGRWVFDERLRPGDPRRAYDAWKARSDPARVGTVEDGKEDGSAPESLSSLRLTVSRLTAQLQEAQQDEQLAVIAFERMRERRDEAESSLTALREAHETLLRASVDLPASGTTGSPRSPQPESAEWQPIEKAPKDGTELLLWSPQADDVALTGYHHVGRWCDYLDGWAICADEYTTTPSHWMPLPSPPRHERL
jgi:hypothetical protein